MKKIFMLSLLALFLVNAGAQEKSGLKIKVNEKATIVRLSIDTAHFEVNAGLFSFLSGKDLVKSGDCEVRQPGNPLTLEYKEDLEITWEQRDNSSGAGFKIRIANISEDTLTIHNIVPFGEESDRVYITGKGDHYLSRTHIFRPGLAPVNVIVPDNAWNLGFCELELDSINVYGLARRAENEKADIRRFENILFPGSSVSYNIYVDTYEGKWQEGIRKAFQDKVLYDVDEFDNTLYEREDLRWIRHSYVSHLIYGWDHLLYESEEGEYALENFIRRGIKWYGGDDFIGIWPTWPSLGLDQRNQWDLFRDMPGGLDKLSEVADMSRTYGSRFFICYNPWDEDTRAESHFAGMADLVKQIGADGVVIDTRGSSSREMQEAVDSVRSGVVMYSEGMAVPKDMPGIVSGRVHNALYFPPLLNLNKMIKPDFAIFRVAELAYEPIRREYATSFFNGYGTELNIFKPGRPDWIEEDYRFFGETVRILRENTSNFVQYDYVPLVPTLKDSIYVNKWPWTGKTIYTVLSLLPEGFEGPLFEVEIPVSGHVFDLWNHKELELVEVEGKTYVPVTTDAFHSKYLGTNNEGSVGCIAVFPDLLETGLVGDILSVHSGAGDYLKIWAGHPDYEKKPLVLPVKKQRLSLYEQFGRFEGDFIIQLFEADELLDERVVYVKPGTPRLISSIIPTEGARRAPDGMVEIPAGDFEWKTTNGDEFIWYPEVPFKGKIRIGKYFMDKHPVTNAQYRVFLEDTGYQPEDDVNFLKHWLDGKPLEEDQNKPVVFVSYEDAKAYADWAGKRLPSELEWQYAAQTSDIRPWPWGESGDIKRELQYVTNTLTVSRLTGVDSTLCNTGNGVLDPVGKYPAGANPFGLEDLVGSVWHMTADMYDNGSCNFVMLKGGSYFSPSSSWWYVQGGPRELHYRQMLLRVSRGFERNGTVGFRCVVDER